MNNRLKKILIVGGPIVAVIAVHIIQLLFNKTYVWTIITETLSLFAVVYIACTLIYLTTKIYKLRWLISKPSLYIVLAIASLFSVVDSGLQASQLASPINIYTGTEDVDPETDTIYVTHNTECEYCKASYHNMIRAVRSYSDSHLSKIQVVDLHDNTNLANKLNNLVDHNGSIVRIDKNGTLHEIMYTTADKDGNPIPNTPNDIYNRIMKVSIDD